MKYSQYDEEAIIYSFFKNKKDGLVVDIGAADGINNSNSRKLILDGWSALLIEPNPNNFSKLQTLYIENENVNTLNLGCSDTTEDKIKFYIDQNDEYEQLSTFSLEQVQKCKQMYGCDFIEKNIDVVKTSEIFSKNNVTKINFLSVDTESYDYKVIKGIDFDNVEIDLICVEHLNSELEKLLEDLNYTVYHNNIGNTFFKKK
jgi:FkbM family methyltransferase